MPEKPKSPYRKGADDGMFFGVYLTVMFFASVLSERITSLSFVCPVTFVLVPFIIYKFLRRGYVEDYGTSTLSAIWMHGIMIFLCGCLLSGAVQLIYMKWINPGFIIGQLNRFIEIYEQIDNDTAAQMVDLLKNMIAMRAVPSAVTIVVEMIWAGVFTGSILSLLLSLLVKARPVEMSKTSKHS